MFYSQFGEDRILSRIFRGKRRGACVEVGANDGVHGSTSLHFEGLGWRCILIEPNPELCREIRARRKAELFECAASDRPGTLTLHVAQGAWRADGMSTVSDRPEDHARIQQQGFQTYEVQVRSDTLDAILTAAGLQEAPDFISIDVEGHEQQVLNGLSLERWKPTVLIIEDNSATANSATDQHLARYGYVRFRRTGVNDWYAHRSNRRLVNLVSRSWLALRLLAIRVKRRLRAAGALPNAQPRASGGSP